MEQPQISKEYADDDKLGWHIWHSISPSPATTFEEYGQVVRGKVVAIFFDHFYVSSLEKENDMGKWEPLSGLGIVYDTYKSIELDMPLECIVTTSSNYNRTLVLTHLQMEKLGDGGAILNGTILAGVSNRFFPGYSVYFPTFGKIGYFRTDEKYELGDSFSFFVACSSHQTVHIYHRMPDM